ncbi:unnamed protein product [Symbiodinium sp. CCMP2592]|nr:unnamed protein product [Symbiodinium sp. CCMP2592]
MKTSGPGKRVRFLPIFISNRVYFMNAEWLSMGWSIWTSAEMWFERDYFLPLPNADASAAIHRMSDYASTMSFSKRLLKHLKQPVWDGVCWRQSDKNLFEEAGALAFWTEHSERHWLVSVLASLGVPPEKRDFVGRRRIVTVSDEYVRAAQHAVITLQKAALEGVRKDARCDLVNGCLCDLAVFLKDRGVECVATSAQADPDDLHEMVLVYELQDAEYDVACKHCWRNGEQPQNPTHGASDASGSDEDASLRDSDTSLARSELERILCFTLPCASYLRGEWGRFVLQGSGFASATRSEEGPDLGGDRSKGGGEGAGSPSTAHEDFLRCPSGRCVPVVTIKAELYLVSCNVHWLSGLGNFALVNFARAGLVKASLSPAGQASEARESIFITGVLVVLFLVAAGALLGDPAMTDARTDDQILASAESPLRYIMDDVGEGFISLHIFAGIDETRTEVREALATELPLDCSTGAEARVSMALLLTAWEACRRQISVNDKNRVEAKLGVQDRAVQVTEYAAMREAVESGHGVLGDKELPSKSLLAQKLEQVEDNAPHVEDLRDVTSAEDAEVESYAAVIDPSSSCLRFKPGGTMTTPPGSPEELRLRHRRIGLAWLMVRTKHTTRAWLRESVVDSFRRLSDHVLGDKVAILRAEDGRAPKWSLVLQYEAELRKNTYKYIRAGEATDTGDAINTACRAPGLLAFHFVTPFSLGAFVLPSATTSAWIGFARFATCFAASVE